MSSSGHHTGVTVCLCFTGALDLDPVAGEPLTLAILSRSRSPLALDPGALCTAPGRLLPHLPWPCLPGDGGATLISTIPGPHFPKPQACGVS